MSAKAIQKELQALSEDASKLTVREHLETQMFDGPSEMQTEKLQDLKELVADTFSNDAVADEMALRIEGLATARIAEMSTTGQDIPVSGLLTQWLMQKSFRLVLKGCSRIAIARQLGVPEATHRIWLTEGHKLLEKYHKNPDMEVTRHQLNTMTYYEGMVTAEGINSNELTCMIFEAAKDDWRAAAHLLSRRYPQDWGSGREKISVEISGEVEVKHTGILAVAPVAANLEEWRADTANIIDVNVKKLPDLTAELKKQEEDA
tara:strand:- start:2891 stop:3673 length:783 start_codon:yes stop_codon:yes gene_type:complete